MTFANAQCQATLNNALGTVVDRPTQTNPVTHRVNVGPVTSYLLFKSALFAYCLYKEFIPLSRVIIVIAVLRRY